MEHLCVAPAGAGSFRLSTGKRSQPPCRRLAGFSLIELLIVMAIIAILTAVAVPAYREHVRKAARADAQSFLTDVASRQQQYLVDKRRYAPSLASLNMALSPYLKTRFEDPAFVEAPEVQPPTFRITLRATGDQAYDKCPTLTIDSAGTREPSQCW